MLSVLAVLLLLAVAAYVRLAQGPVSLDFMRATVENRINQSLPNMSVSIGGVVVERTGETGVPHVRLIDVDLNDKQGNLIARAPRAAIGVREEALFHGEIVPTSIELIGPRIRIMRNLEGAVELGFGEAAPESESVTVGPGMPSLKTDQEPAAGTPAPGAPKPGMGAAIIEILSGDPEGSQSTISSIETIRIADAQIRFYDEANDAIWDIPKAELVFQRMPYGFTVVANATVSNGTEEGAWTADLSASYRRESHSFSISTRINDLVPANVSDEIFALSQLARVKVPLSGHVEMEVTDTGLITKATGEFSAAAGEVGLPDYLAEPLIVDEGSLRIDYDPVTGSIIITDLTLLVGSSRAQVKGSLVPVRNANGRLTALKIVLNARNVAIDAQGSNKSPVAVDRVDFIGNAAIEEARLDIDDLVVMSGGTGIRMRGAITGGTESPGILLSGRMKDLSSALLRQLWPPIVAPKTRKWVNENVREGTITEGEFVVNLPVDSMAAAQRQRKLPPGSIKMSFKMKDVTSGYFKDLPPLIDASGEAKLEDNVFTLTVNGADVVMPSGSKGRLAAGTMVARDILALETVADFDLDVDAAAQPLIEYLDQPALNLIRHTGLDTTKLQGQAKMKVKLSFPMIKDLPKERILVNVAAKLVDASLKDALPGIDISEGKIDLAMEKGVLTAKGPAKIAGIPSEISWQRGPAPGFLQSAVIKTELDGEQRQKLGIDLGTYARGPVRVTATIENLADPQGKVDIAADLSDVEMRIQPIGWMRPAIPKTTAKLTYFSKGEKGPRVEDLEIKGRDLSIKGSLTLAPKRQGLRSANFTELNLSDENRFAATVKAGDGRMDIAVTGDSFDARPLIRGLFGSQNRDEAAQQAEEAKANSGRSVQVSLNIGRVYTYRGEIINSVTGNLSAQGSKLNEAEISGTFLSGQNIVYRVTPVEGGREMRINGRDGGAAIRAANLYSKVAGGQIEFFAMILDDGSVRKGQLVLRNFEVRDEAALVELDARGKPKRDAPRKDGPRRDSLSFNKLTLPFTTDSRFICIGESLVRGTELGASAAGLIRKSDGAIDIAGTITPAYALNSALGDIPLLGDIITGGKGQGIIGLTFAMGGTVDKPQFQMNPVSAVAPGFLRKFFEYSSRCEPSKRAKSTSKNVDNN
ncbi:DUF3971 domain-containing protein [Aestuariivirga sp.]|uniref:YhdP family protein n=1 Tax=Aestuariivirga sp. TaxID=2650926 RepID=UPI003BAD7471